MPDIASFFTPETVDHTTLMQEGTGRPLHSVPCIDPVASSTRSLGGSIVVGRLMMQQVIVAVVPVTPSAPPTRIMPMTILRTYITQPLKFAILLRRLHRRRASARSSFPAE